MLNDISINVSASVVAWYGAIVGTIGLVFSAIATIRDRAKIKILFGRDFRVVGGAGPYRDDIDYASVTVLNMGRRPIKIEKAALKIMGRKGLFLLNDSFAVHRRRTLTEEEPRSEFLVEQDLIDVDRLWYVVVYDARGCEYRKYVHRFPSLWRYWDFLRHWN